jgi:hypothetical protein
MPNSRSWIVAVVSSFASVASIAAPPLLGIAAASTGARHALVLIVVAMVASVLLAGRVAPQTPSNADVPARHDDEPDANLADADPDPYGAIVTRHADHLTTRTQRRRRRRPLRVSQTMEHTRERTTS